jgi:hypothetical protein
VQVIAATFQVSQLLRTQAIGGYQLKRQSPAGIRDRCNHLEDVLDLDRGRAVDLGSFSSDIGTQIKRRRPALRKALPVHPPTQQSCCLLNPHLTSSGARLLGPAIGDRIQELA